MKKLFCLIISIITVLVLYSCGNNHEDMPEVPESPESDASDDTPKIEPILVSALESYRIIIPQDTSSEISNAALNIKTAIFKKYGILLETRDDFTREGTELVAIDTEIVIGKCNRAGTELFDEIKYLDYGYTIIGKKIFIYGGNDEMILTAVDHLIENVINAGDSVEFMNESKILNYSPEYDAELIINGTPLGKYRIVYPDGDEYLAGLANYLSDLMAVTYYSKPDVVSDKDGIPSGKSEYEILLGAVRPGITPETPAEDEFVIGKGENCIYVAGDSHIQYSKAANYIVNSPAQSEKGVYNLDISETVRQKNETTKLRAMSFNIRNSELFDERIGLIFKMIEIYDPDTIGFQEIAIWDTLVATLEDRYGYIIKGSGNIFYKKDKFELLDSAIKYLSDTPDVKSKFPESSNVRALRYAHLRVKETGEEFFHVNTHLNHQSETARVLQNEVLVSLVKEIVPQGMPCIITGDFNANEKAASHKIILDAGFINSSHIADVAEKGATFNNYGLSGAVIDFIFVNPSVGVNYYKACQDRFPTETYPGGYPSDHNPIIIDYEF